MKATRRSFVVATGATVAGTLAGAPGATLEAPSGFVT